MNYFSMAGFPKVEAEVETWKNHTEEFESIVTLLPKNIQNQLAVKLAR